MCIVTGHLIWVVYLEHQASPRIPRMNSNDERNHEPTRWSTNFWSLGQIFAPSHRGKVGDFWLTSAMVWDNQHQALVSYSMLHTTLPTHSLTEGHELWERIEASRWRLVGSCCWCCFLQYAFRYVCRGIYHTYLRLELTEKHAWNLVARFSIPDWFWNIVFYPFLLQRVYRSWLCRRDGWEFYDWRECMKNYISVDSVRASHSMLEVG